MEKWKATKREYSCDVDGKKTLQKTTEELQETQLNIKDVIDLIFKVVGVVVVIITILSYKQTLNAFNQDLKKQNSIFQLETYTSLTVTFSSILNSSPGTTDYNASINKLYNEIYPKVLLLHNQKILDNLDRFMSILSVFSIVDKSKQMTSLENEKYKVQFDNLKICLPYSFDDFPILVKRLKDTTYCNLTSIAKYLDSISIELEKNRRSLEKLERSYNHAFAEKTSDTTAVECEKIEFIKIDSSISRLQENISRKRGAVVSLSAFLNNEKSNKVTLRISQNNLAQYLYNDIFDNDLIVAEKDRIAKKYLAEVDTSLYNCLNLNVYNIRTELISTSKILASAND